MDTADYGLVDGRVDGAVVLKELGYVAVKGDLEKRNLKSGSWAGVFGDQGVG